MKTHTCGDLTVSAEWARPREIPQVIGLINDSRPREPSGEIEEASFFRDAEEFDARIRSMRATGTMVFRINDKTPRKIRGACVYRLDVLNRGGNAVTCTGKVLLWAVDQDLSPHTQKIVAASIFDVVTDKLPRGNFVMTLVSECDLWRQSLLQWCGFDCFGTITVMKPDGEPFTAYQFRR